MPPATPSFPSVGLFTYVALLPLPEESTAVAPLVSSKRYSDCGGGIRRYRDVAGELVHLGGVCRAGNPDIVSAGGGEDDI